MSGTFLFLMRPNGARITEEVRQRFEASAVRNQLPPLRWTSEDNYAVALGPDAVGLGTGPTLVHTQRLMVIGNARLDNRDEVVEWTEIPEFLAETKDLEVIAQAIEACGVECIPNILGDFAFVAWNPLTRELVAARDAFGVKTLYYTEKPDLFVLSSRAAVLAEGEAYDREYIIDFLIGAFPPLDRTIFAGVSAVPPGAMLAWCGGRTKVNRFWSAYDFCIDSTLSAGEQVETFRELFSQAVATRLSNQGDTWAQLSGGLDSSSVVSMAQRLAASGAVRAGVSGTVTLVDSLGQGDEREYAASVLERYPTRNEQIRDDWMWREDGLGPPLTDQPTLSYPFFARDRQMGDAVRAGGGRVLLSGEGADHYLTGSLYFVADLIANGEARRAIGELKRWSTTLRVSFWRLTFQYAVMPFLPQPTRRAFVSRRDIPSWLITRRSDRAALIGRLPLPQQLMLPAGSRYAAHVGYLVSNVAPILNGNGFHASLEVRFPFLYRPLVEFSLRLPHDLRSRPHARKWILRAAMHDILPERVRMRIGKGGIAGRVPWSLAREHGRIREILGNPVLCNLGFVDTEGLRAAVDEISHARSGMCRHALTALSLETWLSVRSGRWTTWEQFQYPQYRREQFGSQTLVTHS